MKGITIFYVGCIALSLAFVGWGTAKVWPVSRSEARQATIERIGDTHRFRYKQCNSYRIFMRDGDPKAFLTFSDCDDGGPALAAAIRKAFTAAMPITYSTDGNGRILYVATPDGEIDQFGTISSDGRMAGSMMIAAGGGLSWLFLWMARSARRREDSSTGSSTDHPQ